MPRLRLTDVTISRLPHSKTQVSYWDEGLPAFGVRVGARRKTFIVILNAGRRIKLGNYPLMTLKDARRAALRKLSERDGATTNEDAVSVETAVRDFIEIHHARSRPRWRRQQELTLERHLLGAHKGKALSQISTKDVLSIIDGMRELPAAQLHVYRSLKTFFSWARTRRLIAVSPMDGQKPPHKEADRDRVLSDKEIVAIYRAAQQLGYPFGHIVLLIFHTALRRGEVGGLRRSYVTDEMITIPASVRSEKKGGELVLPNLINAELSSVPVIGSSDYYFPNNRGGPFGAWSDHKEKFDRLCGVTNWGLHDIRRTVRTKLSEWSCCDDATAERILGHVSSESKVSRIYNRWKQFPQKKAALEAYERKLSELLAGT